MASRKVFCPECGAKIPVSAQTEDEIICPNERCLHIFTLDEIKTEPASEKKPETPRKNPFRTYFENLKALRHERLIKLRSCFLRKAGVLVLIALVFAFAAAAEYTLSIPGGWLSPFADYIPESFLSFFNSLADTVFKLLPEGFTNGFTLYYTVFSFCCWTLIVLGVSALFTRYTFYAAVKLLRFLLAECCVLYVYVVVWPLANLPDTKFVCEDFLVSVFQHIWPALTVIVLLSLLKPAAGFFCARSNRYALLSDKSAHP